MTIERLIICLYVACGILFLMLCLIVFFLGFRSGSLEKEKDATETAVEDVRTAQIGLNSALLDYRLAEDKYLGRPPLLERIQTVSRYTNR